MKQGVLVTTLTRPLLSQRDRIYPSLSDDLDRVPKGEQAVPQLGLPSKEQNVMDTPKTSLGVQK